MSWERQIQEEKMAVLDREDREVDEEEYKEEEEELGEKDSSSSSTKQQQRMDREEDQDEQIKSWDTFLRHQLSKGSGFLRVLLVEGDDSTRHIIAALLRKCNYRVAAVSDGLKAWEILKERPDGIDVVLAEVEVPSITGISLLSMIMDHQSCKHIPVIMMSSHDSINMVFNCMLKGAADFLVKPIRKNELRNLWQHVWRRRNSSDGHGGTSVQQDDNAKQNFEASSQKENRLISQFVPPVQINKECSEKGSDAESSCTRSDMEAESTYKQNTLESQQTSKGFSPLCDTIFQNGGEQKTQLNSSLLDLESKAEACNGTCIVLEEEHSRAQVNEEGKSTKSIYNNSNQNEMEDEICHHSAPPKQIIDLIGAIDNQQQRGYGQGKNIGINNNVYDTAEDVFHDGDFSCKSGSMPLLELSLRRYPGKEEKYERSTLNHSNSSAFSPYGTRTPVSPFSRNVILSAEGEEYCSPSMKQIPDKDFDSSSNVPRWNGTAQHLITEDAKSRNVGSSIQNGSVAIKCSPIRAIPIPIPLGGINFDRNAGYHTVRQPILYPESSPLHLWSNTPSKGQETIPVNSSDQSDTRDFYVPHQHPHNQSPKNQIFYSSQNGHANMEVRDEYVTSVTGDSASSTKCHVNANHIDSNGLGRICHESNGIDISITAMSNVTAELRNQVEKKPTDLYRLNQREAALNKFRLKRKDRCFEKKVRYQSRKRLAEQRPRVKGQFVRHIQPDAFSSEAGSYQIEPTVG